MEQIIAYIPLLIAYLPLHGDILTYAPSLPWLTGFYGAKFHNDLRVNPNISKFELLSRNREKDK